MNVLMLTNVSPTTFVPNMRFVKIQMVDSVVIVMKVSRTKVEFVPILTSVHSVSMTAHPMKDVKTILARLNVMKK